MRKRKTEPPQAKPEDSADPAGRRFLNAGGKIDPEVLLRAQAPDEAADRAVEPADADDDAPNRVVFNLRRDLNKRLDRYLTDRIPFMSRSQLQRLIDEGGVTVNARKPKAATMLRKGDSVEVFVPPPPSSEVQPEDIPLDVLYEDDHLIVLNKRPDIIVHPARSHLSGTMINALAFHFRNRGSGALSGVGREFARPGVVHRLDRHTSGVIVFAKDDHTHWQLGRQFEDRIVEKRYLAVVHGLVEPAIDVIDLPLGPHPSKEKGYREKYVVRHDELGKPSVTIYRVLAAWHQEGGPAPEQPEGDFSLLELELKTGRTHQIRVHLSHLGWPIVGDDMYSGRPVLIGGGGHPEPVVTRQALHAAMLSFRHPATGREITFTAPPPADIGRLVRLLSARAGCSQSAPPPGAKLSLAPILSGNSGSSEHGGA